MTETKHPRGAIQNCEELVAATAEGRTVYMVRRLPVHPSASMERVTRVLRELDMAGGLEFGDEESLDEARAFHFSIAERFDADGPRGPVYFFRSRDRAEAYAVSLGTKPEPQRKVPVAQPELIAQTHKYQGVDWGGLEKLVMESTGLGEYRKEYQQEFQSVMTRRRESVYSRQDFEDEYRGNFDPTPSPERSLRAMQREHKRKCIR